MPRPRTLNLGHSADDGVALRRISGHPALDFANTVDHDRAVAETLTGYAKLVAWCEVEAILTRPEAAHLKTLARSDAKRAQHWLKEAIALREIARNLYSARALGRRASEETVEAFNEKLRRLARVPELVANSVSYVQGRSTGESELSEPVRRLVALIAQFLSSQDLANVRRCEGDDCGWFFIDRSPSKRRRWCSMAACGNREKAHRHYSQKNTSGAAG